ncbi:hypothetical protein J6590_088935 [Homalodisca vitripennis]|nr:hypothetical protein J6590_088935 [Homalodisca vitripennis]
MQLMGLYQLLCESMGKPRCGHSHRGENYGNSVVDENIYFAVIFISKILSTRLSTYGIHIHLDSTFKIVPSTPKSCQLLTLSAVYLDHHFQYLEFHNGAGRALLAAMTHTVGAVEVALPVYAAAAPVPPVVFPVPQAALVVPPMQQPFSSSHQPVLQRKGEPSTTSSLKEGKISIIGVGGIFTGEDAYQKLLAGASLIQLYTAFNYHGPPRVTRIKKELEHLLQ